LSGFVLLRFLGQGRTILLTASVNLTIAIIVILLKIISRQTKGSEGEERVSERGIVLDSPKITPLMLAVLLAYSANGFAGMAYQIAWTRALSLSIGSSTYSFSLILTVFILGLALGAGAGARVVDRLKNPLQVFGWVEIAIGFTAGLAMWGLGRLPVW
jgi:spermidine synthase